MAKAVIEIKDLRKYFGGVKAVDGVSFDVKKGEIFGFLGPNGAGKTTTIRCIMDFIKVTSGNISVLDRDSHKDSVWLKGKIGYLSGDVQLYDKWTGKEHIDFIEKIRGKSKNIDKLMSDLKFDSKKKFKSLSSGNKQKLGLILSLMNQPEILVMDEPTVGLDPLLQNKIYEILEEYKKSGTTIFFSSHNLPEVERVCDRVGIIRNGKLVGIETINELGKKRLRKITVRFEGKFGEKEFDFNGVENIEEIADGLILTVRGDVDAVIKKIAKHKVRDIEITHASLEDVFLEFYKEKKDV
ncbi:ABC transporter ATP-binding protein [candidate division WS5 bacterium]|uniref:ABC transporter ATP-binding protein n=1 Tax=candidate division WS5 bacterium TaxID=2093353 RepID=A0A419DFM4_9BACT|nr:MAG: ABC transporter ATP-binding protein [candidate division WS5 bacterium]